MNAIKIVQLLGVEFSIKMTIYIYIYIGLQLEGETRFSFVFKCKNYS